MEIKNIATTTAVVFVTAAPSLYSVEANSFYEGVATELHVNNVDFDSETVCNQHFLSSFSNTETPEILNSLIRSNSGEKEYSDFLKLYAKIRKSNWFVSSTLNKSLGVQYQDE